MKKILLILLTLLILPSAFASDIDKRRLKIISIIDEELSEVSRLAKQTRNRNPDHLLRMAELNLEKARLWREKENQNYLSLSTKKRQRANKRNYFKKSAGYFKRANNLCLQIVRRFKKYRSIGDVYYILGYNAKEAGKEKTALRYFSKARKKTAPKSITKIKSQISQAELYYNQKKYSKAIPLYERSLNSYKDKWWTKDSFNLAWCYFRTSRYKKSISKMKEVFKNSSSKKYIDMRESVERDIGLFFATAGRIDEGIRFYRKIGINFTDQLLRIAVTMRGKGQYSLAAKTLKYALKYEKEYKKKNEIYIEQLVLYAAFGKRNSHLAVSNKLFGIFKKRNLTKSQVSTLTYQAGKQGAILQKQAIGKTYKRLKKERLRRANMANSYFKILAELEPKRAAEYNFLQGETSFVVGEHVKALIHYSKAFDISIQKKQNKFKAKAMDGMLSSLGKRSISLKTKEKYYIPVYNKYLNNFPKSKRKVSVYQKLFKVYLDRKNYKMSKHTLDRFKTEYPSDWKIQEAMIAELMEIDRKKKRNNKIRAWIVAIDAKKYFVSKKYAKKLRELLTSIQIDDVQMELRKGNKKKALIGYHKILKDPNSTKRSKVNAKYNLAALYYEMGSVPLSFKWSIDSLNEMNSSEARKFSDSFLTISTFLFTQLEFKKSAVLAEKIIMKLCLRKDRKKHIAFKNAAFMYLAEKDIKSVEALIEKTQKCKIKRNIVTGVYFEMLKDYRQAKNWNSYESIYSKLSRAKKNWPKLILPSKYLSRVHSNLGNRDLVKKYSRNQGSFYRYSIKNKLEIPVKALDEIAKEKIQGLKNLQRSLLAVELRYPAAVFQKQVKRKFTLLDRLVSSASRIQEIGSGNGIVEAYNILIDTHYSFADQIVAFKPAEIKKDFLPLFQKDMRKQIISPLEAQAANYKRDAKRAISKNEILSKSNTAIDARSEELAIRFWAPVQAVLMDRGGK